MSIVILKIVEKFEVLIKNQLKTQHNDEEKGAE